MLLFLKLVDVKDERELGLLLENEDGLIVDWAIVKTTCERFHKRRQWDNESTSSKVTPTKHIVQEGRNTSLVAMRLRNKGVKGPVGGTTIDKLAVKSFVRKRRQTGFAGWIPTRK